MMRTLMDSGPLVAFFNRKDALHGWAKNVFETLYGEVYTTEPVITETIYFLRKYGGNWELLLTKLKDEVLKVDFQLVNYASQTSVLMKRYAPRMDLADASLIICAEKFYDEVQIVTVDRSDFSAYRLFGRHVVPIVAPAPKA